MMALVTAVCLMGDSMLYIALPVYWREVGLASLWEVGILLSVNRLVRLPLSPLIGWLYSRMDKRTGLVISVLLAFITTTSYGLLSGFAWWIVLRCLWGVSWTFLRIGAYLTIIDLSDERNRGDLMGTYNGVYRLGSLVGMLVGGVMADLFGLRPIALALGIVPLIALPLIWKHAAPQAAALGDGTGSAHAVPKHGELKPKHSESEPAPGGQTNRPAGSASVLRLLLQGGSGVVFIVMTALLVSMFCEGMLTATLSHLITVQYPTVSLAGVLIGATTVSGILQALRWGWGPWLSPWFGRRFDRTARKSRLLAAVLVGAALFLAVIPFALPFWIWVVFVIGIMLTSTILTTAIDVLVTNAASASIKVAVVTFYTLALDVGSALGPVAGYSMDIHTALWTSAAVMAALGCVWFTVSRRSGENRRAAETLSA
ncbi:MFS transporter [Paenibacillus thalictri]|uniref:MFS transporter n=1 Tax=Paenibacillus thalictri TaxID=2527873 RepID=A0A4V2J4E4_9BACL|nr:MFS transporter [Paenibacillus thalictri]TBL79492.1 MFS transporter [Paenibacillus thalictri]